MAILKIQQESVPSAEQEMRIKGHAVQTKPTGSEPQSEPRLRSRGLEEAGYRRQEDDAS